MCACSEVYLDRIHRVQILTSTRLVNVGDVETLKVQAFDEQGNVFSSLEGLAFDWLLNADGILRRLTSAEARMNVSETHKALELKGLSGDLLPVKGIAPGRAPVTVKLLDV
jgi:nuclear pore complex protein Nup210